MTAPKSRRQKAKMTGQFAKSSRPFGAHQRCHALLSFSARVIEKWGTDKILHDCSSGPGMLWLDVTSGS
jgi:hypothetical protein